MRRELLGYFFIVQAIITGIIVYSIQQLSDSIKASAAYVATNSGQLSWGSSDYGMPTLVLLLLVAVVGLGLFLIVKENKSK